MIAYPPYNATTTSDLCWGTNTPGGVTYRYHGPPPKTKDELDAERILLEIANRDTFDYWISNLAEELEAEPEESIWFPPPHLIRRLMPCQRIGPWLKN